MFLAEVFNKKMDNASFQFSQFAICTIGIRYNTFVHLNICDTISILVKMFKCGRIFRTSSLMAICSWDYIRLFRTLEYLSETIINSRSTKRVTSAAIRGRSFRICNFCTEESRLFFQFGQINILIVIRTALKTKNLFVCGNYGNTGCGVFKGGIQNQKSFWLKINIPKGNY